jgi:hypothetical protein
MTADDECLIHHPSRFYLKLRERERLKNETCFIFQEVHQTGAGPRHLLKKSLYVQHFHATIVDFP